MIEYQLARDPVSPSWQKNLGNRKSSGNYCTFISTIGTNISMEIRGDPVKTQAGIRWRRTTSGRPFRSQQGCGGPGLVPNSSGMK